MFIVHYFFNFIYICIFEFYYLYVCTFMAIGNTSLMLLSINYKHVIYADDIRGRFLIRRSSAIRRLFAGLLRCDNRTIMKSYRKEIARKFSGHFVGFLCKFPVNSRAIFLRNDFIIVRLSHFRNPAINLRIAELRLMRNPLQSVWWRQAQWLYRKC